MAWRRRKSIVNPKQQIWFGLETVMISIGFAVLCAFFLFIPPMSDLLGHDDSAAQILDAITKIVLLKWPLVMLAIVVIFIVGMLMGHRVSGPLLGLEKVITAWNRGDRKARVHFRKYDYIMSSMPFINSLLDFEERKLLEIEGLAKSIESGSNIEQMKQQARQILEASQKTNELE